jgi:spore coat-associated protein N
MRRLRRLSGGGAAVLATNALLAMLALGIAFAQPGAAEGPQLRLAAAAGSLSLSNSREGAAIFSAVGMRPGLESRGSVQIVNTGTVRGTLRLAPGAPSEAPGHGGGWLRNRLELVVLDVTDAQAPVTVYAGRLSQMGAVEAGAVHAGQARQYLFVAELRPSGNADNAYQGALLTTDFTWTASGSEAQTPPATPPAGPQAPPATPQAPSATPQAPPATPQGPASGAAPHQPGGGPVDADPTGAVLGAQVFAMPTSKRCVSRRKFRIHVRRPSGIAFQSVQITVNRRTKARLTGLKAARIKAQVNLRGLPKGKVVVTIVAVTTSGRRAVSTRTYRTCAAKRR